MADAGMATSGIVPPLDVAEDRHPGLGLRSEPAACQQLAFQCCEEALAHGVVVGSGLVRTGDRGDPIRVFPFMSANQAFFPIATMARVLGVSTAGYYAWRSCLPSARAIADDALLRRVRTIHAVSRGTYGAPRVHAELRAEGQAVARKRIARLMRAAGIVGGSRPRGVITTRRDRDARPAPD